MVWRGEWSFVVLNAYPYASGHVLVLPLRHVGALGDLTDQESAEVWAATRDSVAAIETAYDPDGLNMGANLGRAAGAGIPSHVHLHVLPALVGRHELHDLCRRDAGHARNAAGGVAEADRGLARRGPRHATCAIDATRCSGTAS